MSDQGKDHCLGGYIGDLRQEPLLRQTGRSPYGSTKKSAKIYLTEDYFFK